MRLLTAFFSGAAGLCAIIIATPAAEAQSVFQKLFGLGGEHASQPMPQPGLRQIIPPARFQSRALDRMHSSRSGQGDNNSSGPPDTRGPYKTMCVRACDGFYFPIRHNARRRNFDSDIKSCRNACGDDAKLFYYPLRGPQGPEAMVDLAGRKYSDLPKAFAYRKAVVEGCTCKPAPWSYEEAARHQSYADQEAIELEKDKAFLKARAEAAAKTRTDVAAADANGEPASAAETGEAIATASETPDALAAGSSVGDGARLDATSAIQADFSQSMVTTAFDDTDRARSDLQPIHARYEPTAAPRAIRRRSKFDARRATFKVMSRYPSGRLPPKPSVGVFSLFGE